jgi:hypothetical protein
MSVSRRNFLSNAAALSMLAAMIPPEELMALEQQEPASSGQTDQPELPHNSKQFWSGFFDSVNPQSPNYGPQASSRGNDKLADAALETQYFHFQPDAKQLRYATAIDKTELLNHDGDVAVSILLNQFRPGSVDAKEKAASQLRVDATQNHPFMNILAPLAWTALASLKPDKAGKIPSLDQLGFHSDEIMDASSHILLTKGSGKLAINISRSAADSKFLKALEAMAKVAKWVTPFVSLPAVSAPALQAFTVALGYWEDRTRFLINGNLVNAAATQQALSDQSMQSPIIGLVPGDYVVVAKRDAAQLQPVLSQLQVFQGYLVHASTDKNQDLEQIAADKSVPDITYATVKVGVSAVNGSSSAAAKAKDSADSSSGAAPKKKTEKSKQQ